MARWSLLLIVIAFGLAGGAGAHTEDDAVVALQDGDDALMVGRFEGRQPGPLAVVAHHAGPWNCTEGPGTRLSLGANASVTLRWNGSTLGALFDAPLGGYAALAVDTGEAVRALILMEENAIALHALEAAVSNGTGVVAARAGTLGLPYDLPGEPAHRLNHPLEGGGVLIAYEAPGRACSLAAGHWGLAIDGARAATLRPGQMTHVVLMHDAAVPALLPRPVDGSTAVLQLNLYLAREGEDVASVRAALDPRPDVRDLLPLLVLAGGVAALAWPGPAQEQPPSAGRRAPRRRG